jgi:nucleotide-binding universal stress UspA family protein
MEKKYNNLIAVANDFSKESKCAIEHAALIAKKGNDDLLLIHVIDSDTKSALKEEGHSTEFIKTILAEECKMIEMRHGIKAKYLTPEGNIFEDIGSTTEKEKAKFLVMGTHGIKSLGERILGSWALRVVSSSPVPTLIVQNIGPKPHGYKRILMEVDMSDASKYLLKYATAMHQHFNSEIVLFLNSNTDEFAEKKINANLNFCVNKLEAGKIPYQIAKQEPRFNYYKNMVKFAVENQVDMIMIYALDDHTFLDLITEPEQKVIYNEAQIPVMCVTPYQSHVFGNPAAFYWEV